MSQTVIQWFPYLKDHPNSLHERSLNYNRRKKFIVRRETFRYDWRSQQNEPFLEYGAFESYIEWCYHMLEYENNNLISWHEIIDGVRKLFFDIDSDNSNLLEIQNLVQLIIQLVFEFFKQFYNIQLDYKTDVVICQSVDPAGKKISFHIIFLNYAVANNKEAKQIIQFIKTKIPINLHRYIDMGPYRTLTSLRILGSFKLGMNRRKVIVYQPELNSQLNTVEQHLKQYENSLITTTGNYKELIKLIPVANRYYRTNDITSIDMQLAQQAWMASPSHQMFHIDKIKGNIISLKRVQRSWCPLCHTTHDHENPYIKVINNQYYWYCRRNQNGSALKLEVQIPTAQNVIQTQPLLPNLNTPTEQVNLEKLKAIIPPEKLKGHILPENIVAQIPLPKEEIN